MSAFTVPGSAGDMRHKIASATCLNGTERALIQKQGARRCRTTHPHRRSWPRCVPITRHLHVRDNTLFSAARVSGTVDHNDAVGVSRCAPHCRPCLLSAANVTPNQRADASRTGFHCVTVFDALIKQTLLYETAWENTLSISQDSCLQSAVNDPMQRAGLDCVVTDE